MWLPITPIKPEDSNRAMEFARETVPNTYNRMGQKSIERRRFRIYVGKIAEQTVHRYLREELKLDISEDDHVEGPDRFDFRIEYQNRQIIGDVKSFHIYRTWNNKIRTPEEVEEQSLALVPIDQYDGQPKNLYVFAMILGNMDLSIATCFVRWATYADISTWKLIRKGSQVYPYDTTYTDNYGQRASECRVMEDFHRGLNSLTF